MRKFLTILAISAFFLLVGSVFAEPWSTSCADAIGQVRRAQETVHAKQVEVQKAERGNRIRLEQAELCSSGGIVTANRVVNCVRLSREVLIVVQELADAKAARQPALDQFENALQDLNVRCQLGPPS